MQKGQNIHLNKCGIESHQQILPDYKDLITSL